MKTIPTTLIVIFFLQISMAQWSSFGTTFDASGPNEYFFQLSA